ncbi:MULTISPECIES: helix-turn-helix domain-containing protein [Oscillospiraceae]|uniref:Helix-turn-helix transcriptional regulator n=1 Tax=Lawsonibacter faecis TaxID=2763052 RepID=A0A8J6JP45_9FIRM|nr:MULTISPECIES: helix-turn-helix transcriptional regulator [Oscillospiraceae]MBC5738852.1 helix-turn-helix transcriptional regulator [Lawsonibacter faecis]MCQ4866666.1 helix-turn-helix domain-containing protein [Pseudoflavonifractor phocaeensis]
MVFPMIRSLREDRDWTQQYVADRLFIHRRTYSAYENGVNAITPELLIQIAQLYGTSVDYLLGLTDSPDPYPKKAQKKRQT